MNLRDIAAGWSNLYQPEPAIQQLAAERLAICETCPDKRENHPLVSGLIRGTVPEVKSIYAFHCARCACFLAAKAHAPDSDCPAGRWPKAEAVREAAPNT